MPFSERLFLYHSCSCSHWDGNTQSPPLHKGSNTVVTPICRLARSAFLDLHQDRRIFFIDVLKRLEEQKVKRCHYDKEETCSAIVMGPQAFPSRKERDQSENAQHHDNAVEARALPVASAEVQPHPELIERETHGEPVKQRADALLPQAQRREKQNGGNGGEQKDPVVKMMHVNATCMEKEIGHSACHDQDHNHA